MRFSFIHEKFLLFPRNICQSLEMQMYAMTHAHFNTKNSEAFPVLLNYLEEILFHFRITVKTSQVLAFQDNNIASAKIIFSFHEKFFEVDIIKLMSIKLMQL